MTDDLHVLGQPVMAIKLERLVGATKVYVGGAEGRSVHVGLVEEAVQGEPTVISWAPLAPRHDLRNHSPDGFNWGYGGSGPAQLALALAVDVLGDAEGPRRYQDLKWRFVAAIPMGHPWIATDREVRQVLDVRHDG